MFDNVCEVENIVLNTSYQSWHKEKTEKLNNTVTIRETYILKIPSTKKNLGWDVI
jgi:hypothetical protein